MRMASQWTARAVGGSGVFRVRGWIDLTCVVVVRCRGTSSVSHHHHHYHHTHHTRLWPRAYGGCEGSKVSCTRFRSHRLPCFRASHLASGIVPDSLVSSILLCAVPLLSSCVSPFVLVFCLFDAAVATTSMGFLVADDGYYRSYISLFLCCFAAVNDDEHPAELRKAKCM